MKSINNKVIIWGVDDYNVMGLYRQLGGKGLDIIFMVFQGVRGCATKSKYCEKFVVVPTLEYGKAYLLANFKEEDAKPILINSNDLIAEFLDQNRPELEPFFIVPGTMTPGLVAKVTNKSVMTTIAKELGFIVPLSIECKKHTPIEGVEYPCLLKPTHQTLGYYNEFKFKVCKSKADLSNTLKFVRKESTFILQTYIPKESVALVYGCRMSDGQIVLAGILEKNRFCDNGDGSHGVIKSNFPPYIDTKLIEAFFERINFYGLFSVEYGVYNNKAYFFEVNLRNDGTSHLFYQAGANIPLAWIYNAAGVKYNEVSTKVRFCSYFIDELFDSQAVKRGLISKEEWEKERNEATVFKYYDVNDLGPYNEMKRGKSKKIFMDSVVAKYRLHIVYLLDKLGLKRR